VRDIKVGEVRGKRAGEKWRNEIEIVCIDVIS
jgi:hypothetical protein